MSEENRSKSKVTLAISSSPRIQNLKESIAYKNEKRMLYHVYGFETLERLCRNLYPEGSFENLTVKSLLGLFLKPR